MNVLSLLDGKPFQTEFGIVGYSTVGLICDDQKKLLFDCGQRGCALQLKEALKAQGLTTSDITHVVLSHLHFDHVGNLPLFEKAEILLSEKEWNSAGKEPDEWHCRQTYSYLRERGNYSFVREGDRLTDRVSVMELPGHTMGQIGLRCVEEADGTDLVQGRSTTNKTTIFCGDAIKNRYELWEGLPRMSIDSELSRSTVDRIRREADFICPGHDSMLDLCKPCNRDMISIRVRTANGREQVRWMV